MDDNNLELISRNWSGILSESTHRMEMRYDAQVGHTRIPNQVNRIPTEYGSYLLRNNSQGFRSDIEFSASKNNDGRPRIIAIGDSFTEGQGINNEHRFPEQLGDILGAEVFNFGVSGTGPDQHTLIYKNFAKHIAADLVLWAIPAHNLERIRLPYRPSMDRMTGEAVLVPKPYFEWDGSQLELKNVPVPRERQVLGTQRRSAPTPSDSLLSRIKRNIPFKGQMRAWLYRRLDVQPNEEFQPNHPAWILLSQIVRQFREECELPLVIVPLPTQNYQVNKLRPRFDERFLELEQEIEDIRVIPITQRLLEGKTFRSRERLSENAQGHLSTWGCEELANILADEIESRNILANTNRSLTSMQTEDEAPRAYTTLVAQTNQGSSVVIVAGNKDVVAVGREEHFSGEVGERRVPVGALNHCFEAVPEAEIQGGAVVLLGVSRESAAATWPFLESRFKEEDCSVDCDPIEASLEKLNISNTTLPDGPSYNRQEIEAFLDTHDLNFSYQAKDTERCKNVWNHLKSGSEIAIHNGSISNASTLSASRCLVKLAGEVTEIEPEFDQDFATFIDRGVSSGWLTIAPLTGSGGATPVSPVQTFSAFSASGADFLEMDGFWLSR